MMSLSEQAAPYLVAALKARNPGPGADAGVVLGRRLWDQIFGIRKTGRPLPRAVEDLITHPVDPKAQAELEDQVQSALAAHPELEAAVGQTMAAFYRQEIAAGNIQAMVDLGDLLRWQQDYDGAQAAYHRAIEAGNAHALIDLAHLLRGDLGDAEGARAAFQQAIDSGDPDLAAEALVARPPPQRGHGGQSPLPGPAPLPVPRRIPLALLPSPPATRPRLAARPA
jgi:tetratricopeptide (TPR) repeat protein